MSPLTVNLSLLELALQIYWFQKLDIFAYGDKITAQGDGLFLYSGTMPRRVAYPFVTDDVYKLRTFATGQARLEYSDASKREHILPHDWLSTFGYDLSNFDTGLVAGRRPKAVFKGSRPDMGVALLFEEDNQQLGILMSQTVLGIAQSMDE